MDEKMLKERKIVLRYGGNIEMKDVRFDME